MLPTLRPGQVCLFVKSRTYQHGDIVLAQAEGRPVVKRMHVQEGEIHLKGDNHAATTNYILGRHARKNKVVAKMVWPRRGLDPQTRELLTD